MTSEQILAALQVAGNETTKKTLLKHGAREPLFGVKVEELKKLQKKLKTNTPLALQLYNTGISDAMYLAGLIADGSQMTREELTHWAEKAYWYMLSEYTLATVAAESAYGYELAMEWIESDKETIASAGWATLANLVAVKPDTELNLAQIESLLQRIRQHIHQSPNRVRYTMNGFVIAVGTYILSLAAIAEKIGQQVGKVTVDMGGTACKVPYAPDYIRKVQQKGVAGKKRKNLK